MSCDWLTRHQFIISLTLIVMLADIIWYLLLIWHIMCNIMWRAKMSQVRTLVVTGGTRRQNKRDHDIAYPGLTLLMMILHRYRSATASTYSFLIRRRRTELLLLLSATYEYVLPAFGIQLLIRKRVCYCCCYRRLHSGFNFSEARATESSRRREEYSSTRVVQRWWTDDGQEEWISMNDSTKVLL